MDNKPSIDCLLPMDCEPPMDYYPRDPSQNFYESEPFGDDFYLDSAEPVDRFEDMGLRPDLLRGIYAHGLEEPSYIQQRAIVSIATGEDNPIPQQN